MQQITIGPNQAGQRFDKFLHKYLPEAPNSFLYKMLRKKNITLNGKKAEGKEILQTEDEVKLFFSEETFAKFSEGIGSTDQETGGKTAASGSQDSSTFKSAADRLVETCQTAYGRLNGITVLYEDEHALILNKPAGILTQKSKDGDLSLNEWMIGYLLDKKSFTEEGLRTFRPSVCNRLDRNTSGLVLCGKSLAGSQELSRLIRERSVRKFYRTVALGTILRPCRIEGYLVKDQASNKVLVLPGKSGVSDSSYIQTAYIPLKVLFAPGKSAHIRQESKIGRVKPAELTYLEVELITGKPHQIRAHLASTGHPLLGDYKYGRRDVNDAFKADYHLDSQLLHAFRLEFPNLEGTLSGLSGRQITAPLPPIFTRILKDLECRKD